MEALYEDRQRVATTTGDARGATAAGANAAGANAANANAANANAANANAARAANGTRATNATTTTRTRADEAWTGDVRRWGTLLLACVTLLLGGLGCLQSDTLVRVHADGSGEIEVVSLLSEEMAEQAMQMAAAFAPEGEEPAEEEMDLFPVADLEEDAADFGEGVRFVRSEPVSRDGFIGVRAFYEFDDVRKLRVSSNPGSDGPGGMMSMGEPEDDGEEAGEFVSFDLESTGGGKSLLSIHLPKDAEGFGEGDSGDTDSAHGEDSPDEGWEDMPEDELPSDEELAMISGMFGGFRFSLAVETDGSIVRTNSPYAEGNRVTLFDIDFGRLLQDLPKFKEFAGRGEPSSMAEAAEWLAEFEGIKVHLEDEVEIEFAK